MIFFQNCIIQRQKTYFCILGKGKSSVQSICFLKSSYFCVLHPILGKRKLIFEIFDFQLSLMYMPLLRKLNDHKNFKIPLQKPSRYPPDAFQTLHGHLLDTFPTPSKHVANTFHTTSRDLQEPSRHLSNTFLIPSKHIPNTVWTPSRYLPETFRTPSRHLLNSFQIPFKRLQDTLKTPSRHPSYPTDSLASFIQIFQTPSRDLSKIFKTPSRHL